MMTKYINTDSKPKQSIGATPAECMSLIDVQQWPIPEVCRSHLMSVHDHQFMSHHELVVFATLLATNISKWYA